MPRALPSLIGVIHLQALPGAPGSRELDPADALQSAGARAVREAKQLAAAGFDGLILENFGDVPFYKEKVPPETVAAMAVIAAAVREAVKIPIGINVLRNDGFSALAVAAVTGCQFIRVNVLAGVAATDQGLLEGDAAHLIRERDRLGADVGILADAIVKHARTLSTDDVALAMEEATLRAGADGAVVTGATTGRAVASDTLERASAAASAHGIQLYIGSGATAATLPELRRKVHGIIVGSDIRRGGVAGAPLDAARIRAFVTAWKKAGRSGSATRAKGRAAKAGKKRAKSAR